MYLEKFECETTRTEVPLGGEGGFQSQWGEGAKWFETWIYFGLTGVKSKIQKSGAVTPLSPPKVSGNFWDQGNTSSTIGWVARSVCICLCMSHFIAEIPSCSHQVRGVSEILFIFLLLLLSVSLGGLYSLLLWGWMLGKQLLFISSICSDAGYACLFEGFQSLCWECLSLPSGERFVFLMDICFIYHMLDLFTW